MEQHDTEAYLVNTGWIGGPYGIGSRIDIGVTRAMVRAILDGSVRNAGQVILPIFRLSIPVDIPGVDNRLLNPRSLWKNPAE